MPRLKTPRSCFQLVWLSDGRIFAIGGYNGSYLSSAEMLIREWTSDGQMTGQWQECISMLTKRADFAAVALRDAAVLVAGGDATSGGWLDRVELFVPPTMGYPRALGQWTEIQPMPSSPRRLCSAVFSNDAVFIFGTPFCFKSEVNSFKIIIAIFIFIDSIEEEVLKVRRFRPRLRDSKASFLLYFALW